MYKKGWTKIVKKMYDEQYQKKLGYINKHVYIT